MFSRYLVDDIARAFEAELNSAEVTVPSEVGPDVHAHQEFFFGPLPVGK